MISTASKPVITDGFLYWSATNSYGFFPMIVLTWPGRMNPSTCTSDESSNAFKAGGTSLNAVYTDRFLIPACSAWAMLAARSGEVVSNPVPKKTTSRFGSFWASAKASRGE